MDIGTTVRCIHPDGRMLGKDRLYTVVGREGDWIVVQDDWGRQGRYPTARFRLEQPTTSKPLAAAPQGAWPDYGRRAPKLSILRGNVPLRRRT